MRFLNSNRASKVNPLLAYFIRERDFISFNVRSEYSLLLKIIDSFIAVNGYNVNLIVLKTLINSNTNIEFEDIKRVERVLIIRRWQIKKTLRNFNNPIHVLRYKEPTPNKPYCFEYKSKFKVLIGEQHTLHADNWTAEQEQRQLEHYLHLQHNEIIETARHTDSELWQIYEVLELVENLDLVYFLIEG